MNYYNEFDPKAAAWLRELIKAGEIPDGKVDERSIVDVNPYELTQYTQHHFFAGIGGWSYALRLAGWPEDKPVVTGSCPCQPFSAAGKGLGEKDGRHLWPVFRDIIAFLSPSNVFGEQVASAAGRLWLARVRADLENMGYAVGAADLCAAGVGAPHIRQRLYWMANADGGQSRYRKLQPSGQHGQQPEDCRVSRLEHTESDGRKQWRAEPSGRCASSGCGIGRLGDTNDAGSQGRIEHRNSANERSSGAPSMAFWSAFDLVPCADGKARRVEPGSFPLAYGIPGRVGLLRGYGNAIIPPLAAEFIQACCEVT